MGISFFFNKKFLLSKRSGGFISLFTLFAAGGIALGVAALIIALSVINGFEKTIYDRLSGFDAHLQVTGFNNRRIVNTEMFESTLTSTLGANLEHYEPYLANLALVSRKKKNEGVTIKGVSDSYLPNHQTIRITEGTASFQNSDSLPPLIIGRRLAQKLFLSVGNKVTLFALQDNKVPGEGEQPNIEQFRVTGIFESGIAKYDDMFAYTSLPAARTLFSMETGFSGYEIKLKSIAGLDDISRTLFNRFDRALAITSFFDLNSNIFLWIELQKKPIPLVLGLIVLVAAFNIISTLLLIVMEKSGTIGTLKALGASRSQITGVFLMQGVWLGVIGILAGNALAFLLLAAQQQFDIIGIPPSVYFVTSIPIDMNAVTFLFVSAVTLPVVLITSYLPSLIAARLNPITTIRFRG